MGFLPKRGLKFWKTPLKIPSGTNPQVQEDHGDDGDDEKEEGAHLHESDPMHHDEEAGGQYDNDRWAWMQTEVQRISIEQQRQGAEISGLRGDVQRGNRIWKDFKRGFSKF